MDEPKKKMQYGVTNCGFSYEEVVSAFFALKLLKNSEIKNFRFELNACAYKKFDDLIIEVEYQDLFKEKFAIQLKHREPGRDLLRIEDLEKGNKKFLISDYLKRYKELDEDIKNGYKFILFTNTKFANLDNSKCYKVEKVCSPFRTEIFTTNEVYKFEEKTPSGEEFYNNFFLISGQKNFKEMRENIVEMLQKEFFVSEKTACSYILFFEDLQKKLYENTEITRNTVILKLIDLFLGENIMKVDLVGPKMELFGSVLRAFDVTCLPKIDERCNCGTIDIDNEIRNLANVNKMVLSEEKLQERKCQILAIFKKRCLFVRLKEKNEKTICEIVKLCQSLVNYRITFVLDGKIKREGKFFSIKIFHNLALLKNLDFDLYQMIIKKFKIGLQGRNAETLETLQINFGLPLDEFVGPYELFQGFTTGLVVGKKTEILPKPFIKRCLTRTSSFNLGKDQITIHCDDKIKVLNTFIKENNIQAELVTGECNNCFNHVRLVDNSLEWVVTKIDPDSPELFENQLNVICGNPGIGKTTMMKYLVKKCPLNFWIVTVPLKQLNYFLKNKYSCEKFLEKFVNAEEGFVSKIIEFSKTSKNLIFFFDGLDELNEECVDGTIRKINILLEEGYKCWISCTKRLKTTLKQNFGVCSMYDIEEISEENQKTYISEKLKYQKKSSEFIEKAMAKILQTNFVNICKLPLTLYILTEILSKAEDIDDFENYLSLTQIYENFIEGRLKHNLEKAGYDTSTNSLRNIIETFKNCYFIQYRIGALKACLEPQHYKKLKLKNDKFFLKQVEESGDFIGVITEVISDNIVFGHFKIAQYFAALWISENFQKIPLFRRTFLFEPKYLQIRYFLNVKLAEKCPLHLAILNRDFPKVKELAKKHLNDLDEAGRTALHYASFIGTKHSFSDEIPQQLGFEDGIDRKILSFLLELDVDILKKDKLYRWNCFHYADASLSLSLLEELSKKEELELKYLKNYKDLQKLIELCVKYGYVNLLQSVTKLKNLKELDTGESSFLHLALENGKEEIAEFLIESGANLDKVNKKEQTLLHVATFWNCSKIVKKLKIDVNLKDNEDKTALHYAAKKGNLEILKFLIENGALLDPTDVRKRTPLHKAAYMGKTEVVKTLIQKGCDVNFCDNDDKTPLQRACDMDHLDTVKILVENGANINAIDKNKRTVLHYAAFEGYLEVVKFLVGKKIDVTVVDDDGKTAMDLAKEKGHQEVLHVFENLDKCFRTAANNRKLSENLEFDKTDPDGNTLLHLASIENNLSLVEFLITQKASQSSKNRDGRIPLHLAAQGGHVSITKALLSAGAEVNARDRWQLTPLHRAAFKGHKSVVELLIASGADLKARQTDGGTPLHSAAFGGHNDVVQVLIREGAEPGAINKNKETALHEAAFRGCTETVCFLISQWPDLIDAVDWRGRTALHWAAEKGYKHMIRVLVEEGANAAIEDDSKKRAVDVAREEGKMEIVQYLEKKMK